MNYKDTMLLMRHTKGSTLSVFVVRSCFKGRDSVFLTIAESICFRLIGRSSHKYYLDKFGRIVSKYEEYILLCSILLFLGGLL